jgi:hypothetical protein
MAAADVNYLLRVTATDWFCDGTLEISSGVVVLEIGESVLELRDSVRLAVELPAAHAAAATKGRRARK